MRAQKRPQEKQFVGVVLNPSDGFEASPEEAFAMCVTPARPAMYGALSGRLRRRAKVPAMPVARV